ncbi:hypothetical protein NIES2119_05735 [[Phormidium ambiguum] IAM M-71]|uniref:Uncharacterized protein n=1 Tax=[Phormidium ambiguum] IAM M-71 TaxID=454136 RepID=A0A1U7IQN6_9CYAN|nr:hypothetical protein [Phormidium ambiguum]OKH39747.1 hypothetical protein NIES2119_05735 [Phormidium ambiguum IAM M-71]
MTTQNTDINNNALSLREVADLTSNLTGQPLAIIINPSTDSSIFAGETFELRVTVTNQGNKGAIIHIYIDESSGILRQWCTFCEESLALANNSSGEVVFEIPIPVNATPNNYPYLLVIDAPKHYPEYTPIRHQARLQILPALQSAIRVNDPSFVVLPSTSVNNPATIELGQSFDVKITVQNRSERVDRFRLNCPDFPSDWFTIIYPEGIVELGLITEKNSLALNPGATGQITLRFQLPPDIKAGNYSPTIQLVSLNNLDLVLMDVVYLQVLPTYQLTPKLQTLIDKIKGDSGLFRLVLTNLGNTVRDISVSAKESRTNQLCQYQFTSDRIKILSQETAKIDLEIKPNKWWQRPWFGKGMPIEFYIDLEDNYQIPLTPNQLEGTLIWEPRPWWQLLLLSLVAVGAIGSLAFLIWWLFFRPPALPKIIGFTSVSSSYQEVAGDAIYLNWQISHPEQVKTIKIVGLSANDGSTLSQSITYDFSQGIPKILQPFCNTKPILNCQNVRTNARKAGSYVFQLESISKATGNRELALTNTIKIDPLPLPKIVAFQSTRPVYQEIENSPGINLNWKIVNPEQIQELRLIGRAFDGSVSSPVKVFNFKQGLPPELRGYCLSQLELVCRNFPTQIKTPGDYIFELSVVPKRNNGEEIVTQKTDLIKIKAYQSPIQIDSFKINGLDALPKYILKLEPNQPEKNLNIAWKVTGDKNTKVELLPAPGNVPLAGMIFYPLSQQTGTENIILRVTSASGQQISRSITVEKVAPFPNPSTSEKLRVPPPPTLQQPSSLNRTPLNSNQSPTSNPNQIPKPTNQSRQSPKSSTNNRFPEARETGSPSGIPRVLMPPQSNNNIAPEVTPSLPPPLPPPPLLNPHISGEMPIVKPTPILPKPPNPEEVPPQFD